ncbi:MAG TPA: hypothetical protein EYP67_03575 [Methanosarcinales archaeon]|nr:hypothetical protein [Methanosarcinales archaeon]
MKIYVAALLAMIVFSAPGLCDNGFAVDACVTGVDRTISKVASGEFDVTLTLDNITICGITETLASDLTFVSTTHPENKVRVSGQKLSFAVINETQVTYRVSSPTSGTPEITGIWIDLLSDSEGAVGGGAAPPAMRHQTTTVEAEQPDTPGFGTWVLIAMMVAAYLCKRR